MASPVITPGAAFDLGLLTEQLSVEAYTEKLTTLLIQGCVAYGIDQTAHIFREQVRKAKTFKKMKPKASRPVPRPPRKQKGPHNPTDDQLLVQLWQAFRLENPKMTKVEFCTVACKNHIHTIEPQSLKRRLDRALARLR
jgi:hypothetical protein